MSKKKAIVVILLIVLLAGSILVKRDPGKGFLGYLMSPVWRAESVLGEGIRDFLQKYLFLSSVKEENRLLKERILFLQQELAYFKEREALYERLEKIYKISERIKYPQVVAKIIYKGIDPYSEVMIIDKGSRDGIMPQMPILALAEGKGVGLVGQVVEVHRNWSKVILLTDPSFAVDVKVLRTQDRGIVRGKAEPLVSLEFLPLYSQAKEGDLVVTSGQDLLFPSGLLVGEIKKILKDPQGLFQRGEIQPYVDIYNLSYVVVLMKTPDLAM